MTPWSSQPDEAIRRAAAGVCRMSGPRPYDPPDHYYRDGGFRHFVPDQNRDDLARVFVAAWSSEAHADRTAQRFHTARAAWETALTDPRAALTQLLDLLQVPLPAAARE